MKFKINNITVPSTLYLTKPIKKPKKFFLEASLYNLDREGYELLPLEQEYHKVNNQALTTYTVANAVDKDSDGWAAIVQRWIEPDELDSNCYLDHSYCLFRMAYAGEAREQIEEYSKIRPELRKLLAIKPKFGCDFCLDYLGDGEFAELIHVEWDFKTAEEFTIFKTYMENTVKDMDWAIYIKWVLGSKSFWENLYCEEQGNFKAQKFGIEKAFRLVKTF